MKRLPMLIGMLLLLVSSRAQAAIIIAHIKVDNSYSLYDSRNDAEEGDLIGSWTFGPGADTWACEIDAESPVHYLHVRGWDVGVLAGFLGDFTLSEDDPFVFRNGTKHLTTNIIDWTVRRDGWTGPTLPVTWAGYHDGHNGDEPWGPYPDIDADATWIWTNYGRDIGNDSGRLDRFFSAEIVKTPMPSIPEPSSLFLLGSGLLGLAGWRRRPS